MRAILQNGLILSRTLQLFVLGISCFLGFLSLRVYIPIAVGLFVVIESFNHFLKLQPRLNSLNMAAAELQALVIWWGGLSLTERRKTKNKNYLVDVAENALESVAAAYNVSLPIRRDHVQYAVGEAASDIPLGGKQKLTQGS